MADNQVSKNIILQEKSFGNGNGVLNSTLRTFNETKPVDIINRLLSTENDINAKDHLGRTVLMYACLQGSLSMVQFLLNQSDRLDVFAIDHSSNTSLMFCCIGGQAHLADLLLNFVKSKFDVDVVLNFLDALNDANETAITMALKRGHVDCAVELSEHLRNALDSQKERKRAKFGTFVDKMAKSLQKMKIVQNVAAKKVLEKSKSALVLPKIPVKRSKFDGRKNGCANRTNNLLAEEYFACNSLRNLNTFLVVPGYYSKSCSNLTETKCSGYGGFSNRFGSYHQATSSRNGVGHGRGHTLTSAISDESLNLNSLLSVKKRNL